MTLIEMISAIRADNAKAIVPKTNEQLEKEIEALIDAQRVALVQEKDFITNQLREIDDYRLVAGNSTLILEA